MVYNAINGVFFKIMVLWILNRIKSHGCSHVFANECSFDFESSDKEWKSKSDYCIDESDEENLSSIFPQLSKVHKAYCYFRIFFFLFLFFYPFPCDFLEMPRLFFLKVRLIWLEN